jgi:hypothetical protein
MINVKLCNHPRIFLLLAHRGKLLLREKRRKNRNTQLKCRSRSEEEEEEEAYGRKANFTDRIVTYSRHPLDDLECHFEKCSSSSGKRGTQTTTTTTTATTLYIRLTQVITYG